MATEIQTILIKYETDVKAVVAGAEKIIDANEGIVDSEKDVAKEGKKAFSGLQKELKDTEKPINGLLGSIKAIGGAIAAAFTVREVIQFSEESVKLADIQLRAEAQLLKGLQGREDIQQRLITSAAELQKRTIFGDQAIIQQQAFLASLGFSEQKINDVIAASVDLSAATGLTLEGSVRNLAKTYSGLSGELGELIPQLRGLTAEQLQNGEGVRVTTELFKGQAEIIAQTGTGPIIQLQNAFSDLQEEIGKVIIESMPQFTEQLRRGVAGATEFVKQLTGVEERTGKIGAAADTADKAITALRKSFELLTEPMNQVIALFRDMSIEIPGTGKEINLFNTYIKGLGVVIDTLVTNQIENAIKAMQFLGAAIAGVRAALVPGGKTFIEAFNESLNQSRGTVAGEGKKLGEEFGNSFDIGYKQALDSGMSAEGALAAVLAAEKARKEAQAAGKVIGGEVVNGVTAGVKEADFSNLIIELQKQLELIDFRLRFRIDPEGVDLINDGIIYIEPIRAAGTEIDNLEEKIIENGKRRDRERRRRQQQDQQDAEALAESNQFFFDTFSASIQGIQQLSQATSNARIDSIQAEIAAGRLSEEAGRAQLNREAQRQANFTAFFVQLQQFQAIAQAIASRAKLPILIPLIVGSIVGFFSRFIGQTPQSPGFAKGTSFGPGTDAIVGEKGPERMFVPRGARIFTAEATKKERSLIDALNAGKHEQFIHDHYLKPFAAQLQGGQSGWSYDDFQLRQAVRSNKVIELGPKTLRKITKANKPTYH